MKGEKGHQVMQRLSLLSAFLRSKNSSGSKAPTTQDRLQYKALTEAFFLLGQRYEKFIINNLEFNTVS